MDCPGGYLSTPSSMNANEFISVTKRHDAILTAAKAHWELILDNISPKRKLLRKFRERWAVWADKEGFMASRYFDLVHQAQPGAWMDDKTWHDLEFQEIFRRMDATVTPIGSQVLYTQLRKYEADPELLARRYAVYMHIADNDALREALQLRLSKLSDDDNTDLADVLFGVRMEKSPNHVLIWIWSSLSFTLLALVAIFNVTVWVWLAVVFVNVALVFREASREHRESRAMKHAERS
jgi:hypothetical protein